MTLRVAIDARVRDPSVGGVQQAILGLAHGLSQLDGDEEYVFLVHKDRDDWLSPYVAGPCRLERLPAPTSEVSASVRRRMKRIPLINTAYERLAARRSGKTWTPAVSDGTVERIGADLVHFTRQEAFLTEVSSLYCPYDLQHLYLPDLFDDDVIRNRELMYRLFAEKAARVVMMSSWARDDIVTQYGLPTEKVIVVPGAPVLEAYGEVDEAALRQVRAQYGLDGPFLYYPAQTWPHKNHAKLFEALRLLKDEGDTYALVLTGSTTRHARTLQRLARQLGVMDQVHFLGFVPAAHLVALYRLARAIVFPSLFEGWGLPVAEAMWSGAPLACSRVTCLPDLVQDAGLLFDPRDVAEMSARIKEVWSDETIRRQLISAGRRRVEQLTWLNTAKLVRAHYRDVAGAHLTPEDVELMTRPALT